MRRRLLDALDWAEWLISRVLCRLDHHTAFCRGRLDHIRPDGSVIG